MDHDDQLSFGVFKPVGHVVISFPSADQAHAAEQALAGIGLQGEDVRYLSDQDMLRQAEVDMKHATTGAAIGQELNLVKAHHALASQGYHWLVVHAPGSDRANEVAECVKPFGAERAQSYGRFIIEELIEPESGLPQVAESPDRGLDAQTPSGTEEERATLSMPKR